MTQIALRRLALVIALVAAGCAKEAPTPTGVIDRETFVATYVELRDVAMARPLKVLSDEDKERVLQGHGVTEEQLLAYADAWGGDPDYMIGVWEEVRSRVKPMAPPPDSLGR